jgi:glycerophosphoryl diester phosphodiesterase
VWQLPVALAGAQDVQPAGQLGFAKELEVGPPGPSAAGLQVCCVECLHGRDHTSPVQRHPYVDVDGPIAIAHRGGAAGGLENSMAAFSRAVDLGYRYLETDVHATADGVLLAFHDKTLDRVTDRTGRVAELPYAAVRRARIGGAEPIPLLEDLLGAWPDVRVNIDVKDARAVGPLAQVLRRTRAMTRVCVAAFSDRRVALARRAVGPELATALGPRAVAALRAVALGRLPARFVPRYGVCVQVPEVAGPLVVVSRRFVETAHAHGFAVHVWTVDDASTMQTLLDLGVDGLMTDELETLRDVLEGRGAWR